MTQASRSRTRPATLAAALAAAVLATALAAPPARGGEAGQLVATGPIHPCTFFRGQAHRVGMTHFATEMVWACEEIVFRRAAGVALSDRLLATEAALVAYRQAFDAARRAGREAGRPADLSDGRRHELAETTGVLAALEAISGGF